MGSVVNGNGKNGNGKWQLAFWVITVICGAWLMSLTGNVVANDRIRAQEDKDIRHEISQDRKEITDSLSTIKVQLSCIETELRIKNKSGFR